VNNLNLVEAFVKATLASVAELANGWLPPQNFSAVSGTDKVTLSWDIMPETATYKVYKNDMLLTETSSNSYIDNDVVLGETYAYFVKGIRAGTNEESNPSNVDNIVFTSPLKIPYSLDLDSDMDELNYWYYKNWRVNTSNGRKYRIAAQDQFSIMELDWFSIPENVPNISLCIVSQNTAILNYSRYPQAFIEATSDRKTWHKLAKNIDFKRDQLDTLVLSLNDFIGSPFFQIRIRIGSHGIPLDVHKLPIFALEIGNIDVSIKENKLIYFNNLQVFPNPSSGVVTVKTESEKPYFLAIYTLNGKRMFLKNSFQDGLLDLSFLPKGTYLIQVLQNNHQIAKKIVLQ
jgi:hypothetical protein